MGVFMTKYIYVTLFLLVAGVHTANSLGKFYGPKCLHTYNDRWAGPVTLQIAEQDLVWEADIASAVESWNKGLGFKLLSLKIVKKVDESKPHFEFTRKWVYKSEEEAITRISSLGSYIINAHIIVNMRDFEYSAGNKPKKNSYNMRTLIAHELGHFIGLDHIEDSSKVMNPYLPESTVRNISSVEIEAARCLYANKIKP